jgi:hypothetical protein
MDVAFSVHSAASPCSSATEGRVPRGLLRPRVPVAPDRATDVDRDGWTDVVAITEGPTGRTGDPKAKEYTALRGYLNRAKGTKWEGLNIANPKDNTSGDWLAVGNFNDDRFPDFVASTIYFNGTSTVHLSQGEAKKYDFFWDGKGFVIPFRSYYGALAAGRFSARRIAMTRRRELPHLAAERRSEQIADPPLQRVVRSIVSSFSADGKQGTRTPIMRWEQGARCPHRTADFDRDGHST